MKTYIVYVDGKEVGTLKAASHNAAEKKAQNKYKSKLNTTDEREIKFRISVSGTEV